MLHAAFEAIVREQRAAIRATLIRLTGNWDLAEDCVQEASLRAWTNWSEQGLPERPGAWLTTVARRLAIDHLRRERNLCEIPSNLAQPESHSFGELTPETLSGVEDDLLRLIFTCCHPVLNDAARISLTLRTVCGLTTREIARALLEPESTTAQRIVRARRKLAEEHVEFAVPSSKELPLRLKSVLLVIYLVFNEGYAATEGPDLLRSELCREAIRLGRLVVRLLPDEPEARGLLALMLLHDSRRGTRVAVDGALIPLDSQDRSLWDATRIQDGLQEVRRALEMRKSGPYQIQAAIAALHAEAATPEETDWTQIATLYQELLRRTPTPVIELNAAAALAMAGNLDGALRWIDAIEARGELRGYYLLYASKADLLRRNGEFAASATAYEDALKYVPSQPERLYLTRRLAQLQSDGEIQSARDGQTHHST
ncbi:MAG: sigma-70 family RNA polymerase sigma factor [Bryobacteraceae bacterium]|nr:sigma-70 family RNA polymerase sigma factor [Bryobacteraceae bacterium]